MNNDDRSPRAICIRTKGSPSGPVTRLVSPGDLGEILKPFVFVDLANMAPGPESAMRWHPHSGIGTLTIIHEGETAYRETTGNNGRLKPGGIEWMASGRGVWHTASPVGYKRLKGFQIWLLLPPGEDLLGPQSMYLQASDVPNAGNVRLILGHWAGLKSIIPAPAQTTLLDVSLAAGSEWTFAVPAQQDVCWLSIYSGSVQQGGSTFEEGDLIIFENGYDPICFRSTAGGKFIIGSAKRAPQKLHIGTHSVHISPEALVAGETEIQRLAKEMRRTGLLT